MFYTETTHYGINIYREEEYGEEKVYIFEAVTENMEQATLYINDPEYRLSYNLRRSK